MKEYPSIFYPTNEYGSPCIAFRKWDGSNLRFEWSKNKGWFKFGTRHHLFDKSDPIYGPAIGIFLNKYGDIYKLIEANSFVAYAEFLGPNSFSGHHVPDDPKDVFLFDININKKGFMSPSDFVKTFNPEVIYEGTFTKEFEADVMEGKYPVFEGVIVKGGERHKLWMVKIKTNDYIEKLRKKYGEFWHYHM